MRTLLRRGSLNAFVTEAKTLANGNEKLESKLHYFDYHAGRVAYADYERDRLPIGSGAIESGVRRVVNLRFKGNGIFWLEEHAEGLLHLRAQLLAGRWSTFVRTVLQDETFWLIPQKEAA